MLLFLSRATEGDFGKPFLALSTVTGGGLLVSQAQLCPALILWNGLYINTHAGWGPFKSFRTGSGNS